MPMTQEEMVKLLKKYGFTLCKGGKGSHIVNVNIKMYKSDKIKMYNYSKLT